MAAVVKIYECSASMAGTDKTSSTVRFKLADNATIDGNNPITIPANGTAVTRSFTKHLRMYCATAPSVYIDNFRVYTDGSNTFGTGVTVNGSNVAATPFANASSALTDGVDIFTKDSGTPFDLDARNTASVTATGFFGDLIKLQMVVASDASSGQLSSETITFAYDEI